MNFTEHEAKQLLANAGIRVPEGRQVSTPEAAAIAAGELGAVVIKAQVPAGKRGKSGAVQFARSPEEANEHARAILGSEVGGHPVEALRVEALAPIARELYAAVLNDSGSGSPMLMLSAEGGMDIEEVAAQRPAALHTLTVDVRTGLAREDGLALAQKLGLTQVSETLLADVLLQLYSAYMESDAEMLEVNPLAVLEDGTVMALDGKLTIDDSATPRQQSMAEHAAPEPRTDLEQGAYEQDLKYIELDGDVGVLANGAGLTMTTMDVIAHHGGRAANFMEIGGESYTKARPALEIVLGNPRVKSLVVNFCGAFARTDVMTEGVVEAWKALEPDVPVFFSVRGTGSEEAVAILRDQLGVTPFSTMDDAIAAAVAAAGSTEVQA